jgi:hypothetical protein
VYFGFSSINHAYLYTWVIKDSSHDKGSLFGRFFGVMKSRVYVFYLLCGLITGELMSLKSFYI